MGKIKRLASEAFATAMPPVARALLRRLLEREPVGPNMTQEPELRLLKALVAPGRWALDVGANVGSYSLLLAELVGQEHLVCMEPVPDLRRRLQRLLPLARVLPNAASSSRGQATLRVPVIGGDATPSRATLEAGVQEAQQTGFSEILVETTMIDEVVGALGDASVGFIKIDVEGHEREAIRGAAHTLRTHRPVLLAEMEQRHHGYPIKEIFVEVEDRGFRGYFVDLRAGAVSPLEGFDVSRRQAMSNHGSRDYLANFLFFPVERAQSTQAAVERLLRDQLGVGKAPNG